MEAGVHAAAAAAAVPVRSARTLARDLATLTKPKVQSLLLFTTVTSTPIPRRNDPTVEMRLYSSRSPWSGYW